MAAGNNQFAVCVDNTDYTAALEVRKVYRVLSDPAAAARSYLRIIDESGEDYLYPKRLFLRVKVLPAAGDRLVKVFNFAKRRGAKTSQTQQSAGTAKRGRSSKRKKAVSSA